MTFDFFFFIAYPLRSESFFLLLTASWARSLSIINKMNKVVKENRCTLASYCLLGIFFTFTVFKCQSTWVPPYFSSIIINKRLFKFKLLCTKLSITWLFLKVHCSGRHENTGTNRTTHSFFFLFLVLHFKFQYHYKGWKLLLLWSGLHLVHQLLLKYIYLKNKNIYC